MKGRSITFDGLRRSPNRFMRLIRMIARKDPGVSSIVQKKHAQILKRRNTNASGSGGLG